MAEILVMAINKTHADPLVDRRGCYKRGYPVVVMPDGHIWGGDERLPKFVVIKVPGVSVDRILKYIQPELEDTPDANGEYHIYRRRLWVVRWAKLPTKAKNRLQKNGELIVKAGDYAGEYDYTWAQIKNYFRNQKTGLDESDEL